MRAGGIRAEATLNASHIPHSAGKHKCSTEEHYVVFFLLSYLLIALTVGPGIASFSIGCIIWLSGCIIWVGLTVIFYCDVTTGDWAAMSASQAREEVMWKCSARKEGVLPCQHAVIGHIQNLLVPPTNSTCDESVLGVRQQNQIWIFSITFPPVGFDLVCLVVYNGYHIFPNFFTALHFTAPLSWIHETSCRSTWYVELY